ncbi:MAG: methyltransferase domain-containing protein [Gammaproteobacteria bacterium]|nr:methyltransferase domain-containing protein [Gammaproteobacteria bacterium]
MHKVVEAMQIEGPQAQSIQTEFEVMTSLLSLSGARVLELGCGAADKTRQIAEHSDVATIVASEVDQVQHQKNLQIADLPKVTFKSFGAEAIDELDASFDIVMMFKSLHHVPVSLLDTALSEIHRVLKPGGVAYISEPVFAGEFNEVIRLFHDESVVRREAFAAVERAVVNGVLELVEERFFRSMLKLESFAQFEQGILNVTHTEHNVTPDLLKQVCEKFESNRSDAGYVFEIPNRVDLLRK